MFSVLINVVSTKMNETKEAEVRKTHAEVQSLFPSVDSTSQTH